MSLTFAIQFKFDAPYNGRYVARFWDVDDGFDTIRVVPRSFWRLRGLEEPHADTPPMFAIAMQWGANECSSVNARRMRRRTDGLATRGFAKMTLAEVWRLYKEENPKLVSSETLQRDEVNFNAVSRHIDPITYPESIDMPAAVRLRNALREEGLRWRTIRDVLDFLLRLVRFAKSYESVTGMTIVQFTAMPELEEEDALVQPLDEQQLGRVIEALRTIGAAAERNVRMVIYDTTTMLRREPLYGHRGEWADFGRQWLTVPASLMKKGRAKKARELSIPLCRTAIAQLGEEHAGYTWPNPATSKPLTWLQDVWIVAAAAAHVEQLSLQRFRKTGATILKTAGVDDRVIGRFLGHADSTMTATPVYARVFDGLLREAAAVFDEAFERILGKKHGANVVTFGVRKKR
jgi:integrase